MNIDILIEKLATSGLVIAGKSLFREAMPAETTIGVMIRPPLTGINIDPYISGWHKTRIQVITRHTDPLLGQNLARDVCKALTVEAPEIHPATAERAALRLVRFYPETLPVQFPRLKSNGLEISQHFQAVFATKPDWK